MPRKIRGILSHKNLLSRCWQNPESEDTQETKQEHHYRDTEITEHEKFIIKSQWPGLSDKADAVSIDIFSHIFELKPEAKQLFPFRNEEGAALRKHPYFRGHAMRFLNAVKMTIANLDAWEVILIPSLLKLGQQHANINGFRQEYFDIFYRAMHFTWEKHLGKAYTPLTRTAWGKIFKLIMSTIEQGYVEGLSHTNKKQDVSAVVSIQ